jgi:hypothetical protein
MSEDQRHMTMKKGLRGILVATQLMGTWLAVAQADTRPTTKLHSSVVQVNTTPVAAVSTGRTNPAIAVLPTSLDFGPVAVGGASKLTVTVQNAGKGILTGAAKVSAPFSVVGGSPYVLGSSQSQVITLQFAPKSAGMNITVIRLTGGGGANVTVAGLAVLAPRAAPAPPAGPASPLNLRLIAGR